MRFGWTVETVCLHTGCITVSWQQGVFVSPCCEVQTEQFCVDDVVTVTLNRATGQALTASCVTVRAVRVHNDNNTLLMHI